MALKSPLVIGSGYSQAIQPEDTLSVPALQSSGQITSTVSTGTAPLVVTSTTKVTNLNADLLDGFDSTWFQQALVSGTNIKTINGASILGSGDISVSGGGSQMVYVQEAEPVAASPWIWFRTNASGDVIDILKG